MSSSYKSAQDQQGQAPQDERGQVRRFTTPAGERLRQGQQPFMGAVQNQGVNQPPVPPMRVESLPTGMLPPSASPTRSPYPPGPGARALLNQEQRPIGPTNQVMPASPPQTPSPNAQQPWGAQPGTGRTVPNPPSNGSGLLSRQQGSPMPQMPQVPQTPLVRGQQPIEMGPEGSVILHRAHNFFVRTTYRPGRPQPKPLSRPTGRTTHLPKVMPNQNNRVAASETRMMPVIAPINPVKAKQVPIPPWLEAVVIVIGLTIAAIAHALNMFNFPRYELDEGTYMSSAWAVMNGLITPYAYGYGHPPLGWIQIAAWVQLTGGFFTFGNALNSGRVLMLFYALGSALLVYLIVRRLGASRSAGLLAMVIFSLSPLAISYQRQTLLDNIATFWLLLSIYLLVVGDSRLSYIVGAAIAFGMAFLSKEVFVLFLPVMIYAVWLHTTKFQRKFALVAFIYAAIAIMSSFVLMALLRGELFPYSWHLPWDTHDHLSMWDTFIGQSQRTQSEGSLAGSWAVWTQGDLVLIILSIAAPAFNLLVGWWNRKQLMVALFAVSFWLLLIRGGVVLSFYLIPLIPLTAINTAFAVNTIMGWLGKLLRFDFVRAVLVFGVIAAIVPYDVLTSGMIFTMHPTSPQTEAMTWIRAHVPRNDFLVINSYLYMDLRQPGGAGVGDGAVYPYAHVYFNVATDPEIYKLLLDNNSDRIDYIVADSEMETDIRRDPATYKIILDALNTSILRAEFSAPDRINNLVIRIYEVRHKFAQPVAMAQPGSQQTPSANVAIQLVTRGMMPIDRRLNAG